MHCLGRLYTGVEGSGRARRGARRRFAARNAVRRRGTGTGGAGVYLAVPNVMHFHPNRAQFPYSAATEQWHAHTGGQCCHSGHRVGSVSVLPPRHLNTCCSNSFWPCATSPPSAGQVPGGRLRAGALPPFRRARHPSQVEGCVCRNRGGRPAGPAAGPKQLPAAAVAYFSLSFPVC